MCGEARSVCSSLTFASEFILHMHTHTTHIQMHAFMYTLSVRDTDHIHTCTHGLLGSLYCRVHNIHRHKKEAKKVREKQKTPYDGVTERERQGER